MIKLVNTVVAQNGWGEVLNNEILKKLEKKGLPVEKTGSKKKYSIFELAVFLLIEYTVTNENKIDKYKNQIIDEIMKNSHQNI